MKIDSGQHLAPIGLSAYSRLEHLRRTVSALQANNLAVLSDLHVFSDAPRPGDEEKVAAVRTYLKTIGGFKSIQIYEREKNNRIANNRGGMRMLLDKFGKIIFIEEDSVTAPNFLDFMNNALNLYQHDKRIFSICAYFPSINIPKNYQQDIVMSPRMNAWAFGIWKDRFDKIEMGSYPEMYSSIFEDHRSFIQYGRGGDAVFSQLKALSEGKVDGLDIRIDYTMFKLGGLYTLCPTKSLLKPIGCDGSGEHWTEATNRHDIELKNAPPKILLHSDIQPNNLIIKNLRSFNNQVVPFRTKLILSLHRKQLYYPIKRLIQSVRILKIKMAESLRIKQR